MLHEPLVIRNRYCSSSVTDEQSVGGVITDRSYSASSCTAISILHILNFQSLEKLPRNLSCLFRSSTRLHPEHQFLMKGV